MLAPYLYEGRRIDHLINASGYLYRNGYKNVGEFMGTFGFDPRTEPQFFKVLKNGIVWALPKLSDICNARVNQVRLNWGSIIG